MDTEKRIPREQVVPVVEDLIRLDSQNPGSDESLVTEYIRDYMDKLGVPVTLIPVTDRRVNLVARIPGSGQAEPIAFTGHMDVVPVNEAELSRWETPPFEPTYRDGKLFGRGSTDMKGGLGAAMAAMGALRRRGVTPPGDVLLIATVDEEDMMRGAKTLIGTDLLRDVRDLVVCEPTDMKIICSGRGRSWADVTLVGRSGHASIENNGNNAILQAMELIRALREEQHRVPFTPHPQLGNFFWQVTVIHGGVEPAMVPDTCVATVDTRPVPGQTCAEIWDKFFELVAELEKTRPGFRAETKIIEVREPWETPRTDPLVLRAERCFTELGLPIGFDSANYTTDGCVFSRIGVKSIIIGPGHIAQAHRENEWVDPEQLVQAANVYYALMTERA